jgi:hypothetical protein
MTTDVLKPCPICGGRAILEDRSNFLGDPYWEPVCDAEDCVLSGHLRYPTQAEAIAVWNNREGAETAERPDASDYRNAKERAEAECLELRAENARLRQAIADMANSINIVGSPYDRASNALDEIVHNVKRAARQALGDHKESQS